MLVFENNLILATKYHLVTFRILFLWALCGLCKNDMNVSKPSLIISKISDGKLLPRYPSSVGPDSFQCILSYRHLSKEL